MQSATWAGNGSAVAAPCTTAPVSRYSAWLASVRSLSPTRARPAPAVHNEPKRAVHAVLIAAPTVFATAWLMTREGVLLACSTVTAPLPTTVPRRRTWTQLVMTRGGVGIGTSIYFGVALESDVIVRDRFQRR